MKKIFSSARIGSIVAASFFATAIIEGGLSLDSAPTFLIIASSVFLFDRTFTILYDWFKK